MCKEAICNNAVIITRENANACVFDKLAFNAINKKYKILLKNHTHVLSDVDISDESNYTFEIKVVQRLFTVA